MKPKAQLLIFMLAFALAACNINITAVANSVEPKEGTYSAPLDGAESARVTLGAVLERITVNALDADDENLIDAQIDYVGEITSESAGDAERTVTLTEKADSVTYSGESLEWLVHLNPSVPLDLDVHNSSGGVVLDLSAFVLTGLKVDVSSGSVEAELPATGALYEAALTTSSGDVTVGLADGAQVNFSDVNLSSGNFTLDTGAASSLSLDARLSSGAFTLNGDDDLSLTAAVSVRSGNITLGFGENSAANVTLSSNSGNIVATIPPGAAVRLDVQSNSSGEVRVPTWITRVSGDDNEGVWESDRFSEAERQITIVVTSSSSGDVVIQ